MKHTKFTRLVVLLMAGSVSALASFNVLADQSTTTIIQNKVDDMSASLDDSMQKLGSYMDESGITAKVKTDLLDHNEIKSRDISVETHKGVVTLSGFVASQAQAAEAVALTEKIAGVVSVEDKLHVSDSTQTSIRGYVDDAAITSKIKGKFLREDMTVMRNVRVETSNGIVQLSGTVPSQAVAQKAGELAKSVEDVKSIKNDLTIAQ